MWSDLRRTGPMSTLDKRRTIKENIKRNALAGKARFGTLKNDDLRFRPPRSGHELPGGRDVVSFDALPSTSTVKPLLIGVFELASLALLLE